MGPRAFHSGVQHFQAKGCMRSVGGFLNKSLKALLFCSLTVLCSCSASLLLSESLQVSLLALLTPVSSLELQSSHSWAGVRGPEPAP